MTSPHSSIIALLTSSLIACGSEAETLQETPPTCVDKINYQSAVQEYYQESNPESELLPPTWPAWMNDNYDRYCQAFDFTQYSLQEKGKTMSVVVF